LSWWSREEFRNYFLKSRNKRRWILKQVSERRMCPDGRDSLPGRESPNTNPMKPSSIRSLLLVSALFMPHARGQDAEAKIRDIEQTVLLKNYEDSVKTLAATASGPDVASPEAIGKQLLWLAKVDSELGAEGKATAAGSENMPETAGTLNDMAWRMVTAPEAAARQPETALKLATLALELGAGDKELLPKALDTKARALFLLGRQGDAIAEQEKAVAASEAVPEEKAGFEATLAAYRKNELPPAPPAIVMFRSVRDVTTEPQKELREQMDRVFTLQMQTGEARDATSEAARKELEDLTEQLRKRIEDMPKTFGGAERPKGASSGPELIVGKLKTIILPKVEFEDTSLEEAVDFLRVQSKELDTAETDPSRKGVNFVIRLPRPAPGGNPAPGSLRVKELRLRNVPLDVTLKYICESTRLRYKVDDFAVTLVPQSSQDDLFHRTFRVPEDFGSSLVSIQDLLKTCGINFGEGASAKLISPGELAVVNTPTELDKIEELIPVAEKNSRHVRGGTFGPVPEPPQPRFPAQPDVR